MPTNLAREQFEQNFGHPLVAAMDDCARCIAIIQHLQGMAKSFTNHPELDKDAAKKPVKRVLKAAMHAARELQKLTFRKVTANRLDAVRAGCLKRIRPILPDAENLAAQEHAAMGRNVIKVGVLQPLQEIANRWARGQQVDAA